MKRICLFHVACFVLLVCRPSKDSNSGGDHSRIGAVEIQLGAIVDDKVSSLTGDNTDWKRFNIESDNTPLKINIYWDNLKVKAKLALRDIFGGEIKFIEHTEGSPKDSIEGISLKEGTYFIEIEAKENESVYSIEVLAGEEMIEGGGYGIPRPE